MPKCTIVRIRLATGADGAAVREIYRPAIESSAISFETAVPTIAEMTARVAAKWPAHPWLVATDDAEVEVLGYAYAGAFAPRAAYQWAVETSVYIAEGSRGRGVGRALYTSLFAVLAVQGYRRAFAGIALPNPASVALHERMGFTPRGVYHRVGWKLGAWHDVGWWQRDLGGDGPPEAVTALSDLAPATLDAALRAGELTP